MECVVIMGIRLEFYIEKLKEVEGNIDSLSKSIINSRYIDIMDKNGNIMEEPLDQQIVLDELISFKNLLTEKIGAMQSGSEML